MSTAIPNNAVLANAVDEKHLKEQKKHLEHVPLTVEAQTATGGVHLGPAPGQADFAVGELHTRVASSTGAVSRGGNATASAASGEVSVQSSVVTDTVQHAQPQASQQIQALLSRLSTTTQQVDDYSRRANERISADATRRIEEIIRDTALQQDALLKDASARSLEIEGEYNAKLKAFLQELDASKASNLAALEKDLDFRQSALLGSARDAIDAVHQDATRAKLAVMQQANAAAINDVDRLTEKVRAVAEAEVDRRLNSTTTTVITTQTVTDTKAAAEIAVEKQADISQVRITSTQAVATEPRSVGITKI